MKRALVLSVTVLLVLGLLLAAGCGGGGTEVVSVEGTYVGPSEDMTLELRADGSYVLSSGPSNVGGSYEVKGDEIIFEFAGVDEEMTAEIKDGVIVLEEVEYKKQ